VGGEEIGEGELGDGLVVGRVAGRHPRHVRQALDAVLAADGDRVIRVRVVPDHHDAVEGHAQIELHSVGAHVERGLVRGDGVLGGDERRPAVADDEEVGVLRGQPLGFQGDAAAKQDEQGDRSYRRNVALPTNV